MATNLLPLPVPRPPPRRCRRHCLKWPYKCVKIVDNMCGNASACLPFVSVCEGACLCVPASVCVCEGAVIAIFSLASLPFCCLLLLYNFRIRRVNVAASGQASARIGLCMRHLPRLQPPSHLLPCLPHIEHFICQALAQRDSSWHAFK